MTPEPGELAARSCASIHAWRASCRIPYLTLIAHLPPEAESVSSSRKTKIMAPSLECSRRCGSCRLRAPFRRQPY